MKRPLIYTTVRAQVAVLAILTVVAPVQAHNKPVHQDIVDLAYQVMRAVEQDKINPPPPPGVSPSEWNRFLASVKAAPIKFRQRPTALPPAKSLGCAKISEGVNVVPLDWAQTINDALAHPVSTNYIVGSDCGIRYNYTPGGIYNTSNPADSHGKRDFTGTVLGFWGAAVDDEFNDTHLWLRPTATGLPGKMKDVTDDAGDAAGAFFLIPIVCFFELLAGDASSCASDSFDAGDDVNKFDDLEGAIPGAGDLSGEDFVGFWHHIKILGPATNEFDDHQGLLFEEAGPFLAQDPIELALTAYFDLGYTINYDDSNGPKRYSIFGADDSHQNTKSRTKGEWQFVPVTRTPMEPLDNLAFYGWKNFRDSPGHELNHLGWPLHAFGDAIVPMHVAGTPAWGHQPFEKSAQDIWGRLRYLDIPAVLTVPAPQQVAQATAILWRAFYWRNFVTSWRDSHPGHPTDIPIRDMITSLAQNTGTYAMNQQATKNWPFDSALSTAYQLGGAFATGAVKFYSDRADAVEINQPLIVDGTGGVLAFLMSAAEVLP